MWLSFYGLLETEKKGEWDRMDYDLEIDCFVAWRFVFIYCVRVHGKRTLSN